MKRITVVVSTIAIILSGFSIYYAKTNSKLVYVDVNKLIEGYKRTQLIKADFEKKATVMKGNIDSLLTNWQNELKVYEKERISMSSKELKLKEELLANKQQQINNYQEAVQKRMQEEEKKVSQTVINDINDYVKQYGEKSGYSIIFGASGTGNIMYGEESSDLTKEILEGLNSEYEGKK